MHIQLEWKDFSAGREPKVEGRVRFPTVRNGITCSTVSQLPSDGPMTSFKAVDLSARERPSSVSVPSPFETRFHPP